MYRKCKDASAISLHRNIYISCKLLVRYYHSIINYFLILFFIIFLNTVYLFCFFRNLMTIIKDFAILLSFYLFIQMALECSQSTTKLNKKQQKSFLNLWPCCDVKDCQLSADDSTQNINHMPALCAWSVDSTCSSRCRTCDRKEIQCHIRYFMRK